MAEGFLAAVVGFLAEVVEGFLADVVEEGFLADEAGFLADEAGFFAAGFLGFLGFSSSSCVPPINPKRPLSRLPEFELDEEAEELPEPPSNPPRSEPSPPAELPEFEELPEPPPRMPVSMGPALPSTEVTVSSERPVFFETFFSVSFSLVPPERSGIAALRISVISLFEAPDFLLTSLICLLLSLFKISEISMTILP